MKEVFTGWGGLHRVEQAFRPAINVLTAAPEVLVTAPRKNAKYRSG